MQLVNWYNEDKKNFEDKTKLLRKEYKEKKKAEKEAAKKAKE